MVREFSKEELKKVEKLTQTKTSVEIAEYFGLTATAFKYLKKKYPDLKESIVKGIEAGGNCPKKRIYKKKVCVFTKEELIKIENLTIRCNYREIAEKFELSEHKFRALRKTNAKLREAIERGVEKRNNDFVKSQKERRSEQIKKGKAGADVRKTSLFEYDDKITALQKFREEFEENKWKRLKRELNEIDLI